MQPTADDMPLLSQWIKKEVTFGRQKLLLFWRSGRDLRTQLRALRLSYSIACMSCTPSIDIPSTSLFHPSTSFLRLPSFASTNVAKQKSHPIGWLFCLAEKERLSSRFAASHLANIVEILRAYRRLHFSLFAHSLVSLLPPPAAVASLPLAGARLQIFSDPQTKEPPDWVALLFGGEGEI